MKTILIVCLFVALVFSTYITKADVEDCIVGDVITCDKKISVGVSVSYGLTAIVDSVSFSQVLRNGESFAIEETVRLHIEKSAPQLKYPLLFEHTVNYNPYEEVIKVKNPWVGVQKCIDSPTAEYPTCGWYYLVGVKQEHSQGFCCNKDMEMLTDPGYWRGEEILEEQSTLTNSFSTGHCMRLTDIEFNGYSIGTPSKYFEVTVTIQIASSEHTFKLSPATIGYSTKEDPAYTGNFNLRAELVGDYGDYDYPPDLSNYILYIPFAPLSHEYVVNKRKHMLLVPREEVTIDGSECNKVGVSFATFRQEGNKCSNSLANDCLHSQLHQKHTQDLNNRITNPDMPTKYLMDGLAMFKGHVDFNDGRDLEIAYTITQVQNSMINLVMDFANIKLITTESDGRIVYGHVLPFASASQGTMEVGIVNQGDIKADYIISVVDCNMNIMEAIPAQAKTLEPNPLRVEKLYFKIFTTQNMETTNACTVKLKSPTYKVYDELVVVFDTKMHETKYADELRQLNEDATSSKDKMFELGSCDCDMFDLVCKFVRLCVMDIVIMLVAAAAVIGGGIGLVIFFIAGGGQLLPSFLCYACRTAGCCLKCVGCFTRFFLKEAVKGKKGKRRHRRHHHHHHHSKKKTTTKKTHRPVRKQQKKQTKKPLLPRYETIAEEELADYVENSTVCYMNVSTETEYGKEMLSVLRDAMPLKVGDDFCLVGTLRQKNGQYQFICHEDLLLQTWYYKGGWKQCADQDASKRIPDDYRGYSLELDHVLTTISKKPWPNTVCINQPLEL